MHREGAVRFVQFSYYKTANRTIPCGTVRCGVMLLAVQCGYAIWGAVLMRFLRFVWFMRFGKHNTINNKIHSLDLKFLRTKIPSHKF